MSWRHPARAPGLRVSGAHAQGKDRDCRDALQFGNTLLEVHGVLLGFSGVGLFSAPLSYAQTAIERDQGKCGFLLQIIDACRDS